MGNYPPRLFKGKFGAFVAEFENRRVQWNSGMVEGKMGRENILQVKVSGLLPRYSYSGRQSRPQFCEVCEVLSKGVANAALFKFRSCNSRKRHKYGVYKGVESKKMSFQNKVKFPLWAYPETMKDVEVHYKNDNCKSQSEFIEKAIKFYVGYLDEEKSVNYISPMITETVKAQIKGTEQRLARLIFKVAVELGKLSHMTAAMNDIDDETLKSLHAMCVTEVRKINGIIDYEDAVEYQKE